MTELSTPTRAMLVISAIAAAVLAWALLTRGSDNDPIDLGKLSLVTTPTTPEVSMIGLKRCLRAEGFSVHAASERILEVRGRGLRTGTKVLVLDPLAPGEVYGPDHPGAPADWGVSGNAAFTRTVPAPDSGDHRAVRASFFGCVAPTQTS